MIIIGAELPKLSQIKQGGPKTDTPFLG